MTAPRSGRASHEVVRTRGGALAIRSLEAGEVMHPGVGPLVEAERLYVRQSRLAERLCRLDPGDAAAGGPPLVLFDVGLGAGSNALAARAASERSPGAARRLELVSFERDLGALELALAHGAAFGLESDGGPDRAGGGSNGAQAVRALLAAGRHETARTVWRLQRGDLLEALARERARADIVFWDPFSPRANPSLWTVAAFSAMRRAAAARATLFTYSASTAARVAMLLAGWAVGVGEPIGDKLATTAAAIDPADLARPLDRAWLGRLARPDVPLPADAGADFAARVARAPQFSGDPLNRARIGPGAG
jgi:queuine tRNA-ribosyltransferase